MPSVKPARHVPVKQFPPGLGDCDVEDVFIPSVPLEVIKAQERKVTQDQNSQTAKVELAHVRVQTIEREEGGTQTTELT